MANYTAEFEMFWGKYPRRWHDGIHAYVKRKKQPAFKTWQKLSQDIRDKCLRIVKKIKAAEGTPRDAVTWLNQEGWDDIEEAEWKPSLPLGATNSMKSVPESVDTNNERNRQRKGLDL